MKRFFSLIIICCWITAVFSINLGTLTLRDVVMLALRNNPQVQSSELNRVNDKYKVALAYYQFQPQYSLQGSTSYQDTKNAGVKSYSKNSTLNPAVSINSPLGTNYNISMNNNYVNNYNPVVTATITQPLLQGFGTDVVLNDFFTTLENEKINRMGFRDTITQTIVDTVNLYNQLISAQRSYKIQQLQLKESVKSAEDTQKYIKAGTKSNMDYIQAQSQVANGQLSLISSQNSIQQAKIALLQELGLEPDTQFNIVNNYTLPALKIPSQEQAIHMALAYNNSYQSLIIQRKALERALIIAKDAERWKLDLKATATTGSASGSGPNAGFRSLFNGLNNSRSIELDLTVPLDPLQLRANIVSAKIALEENTINIANTKRSVISQVINAYRDLDINKRQIDLAINAEKLQQQVLDNSLKQNKFGRVSQFEVNSNRQQLIQAQLNVVTAENNYSNSLETFSQLIGVSLQRWGLRLRY
ncbi:MAG: TolC family protein [Legionellales bacterium]|nr:TolC family protein [Legionellales bacterium]